MLKRVTGMIAVIVNLTFGANITLFRESTVKVAMVLMLILIVGNSQAQVTSNNSSQASTDVAQSLKLKIFAERTTIEVHDTINVRVWVESKFLDSAEVNVFFAKEQFGLIGDNPRTVMLPMDSPMLLTFIGNAQGESNILVYVSGINKVTREKMTETQEIRGIEVQSRRRWWTRLFPSAAIVGVLTLLMRVYLN